VDQHDGSEAAQLALVQGAAVRCAAVRCAAARWQRRRGTVSWGLMLVVAAVLVAVAAVCSWPLTAQGASQHSVRWDDLLPEPGVNQNKEPTYHNSMPIGNGHMTANINFESASDTLAVMITASSFWFEDGEMGKVGLLTLQLPSRGGAALGTGFSQTFDPQDATVRFTIPAGKAGTVALDIVAYVDATSDSLVASITPPVEATFKLTLLRPVAQQKKPTSDCSSFELSADVLASADSLLYHRNSLPLNQTYMARALGNLNIPTVPRSEFVDPLNNRATGFKVATVHAVANHSTTFAATLLTAQTDTASQYVAALEQASASYVSALTSASEFPPAAHRKFWASKWARHSIEVSAANITDASMVATAKIVSDMYGPPPPPPLVNMLADCVSRSICKWLRFFRTYATELFLSRSVLEIEMHWSVGAGTHCNGLLRSLRRERQGCRSSLTGCCTVPPARRTRTRTRGAG
jgi:hypothetical protein